MPDIIQVISGLISSYFGMLRGQDTYFQLNIVTRRGEAPIEPMPFTAPLPFGTSRVPNPFLLFLPVFVEESPAKRIHLGTKPTGKPSAGNRPAGFDVAGAGNVLMGAGLRPGAKAPDEPPDPTGGAPAPDPTCVQQRLVCSAGDSPAGVIVRSPVAWIAGRRETEFLKPIDKVSLGEICESSGHNASERASGLDSLFRRAEPATSGRRQHGRLKAD